MAEQNQSRYTSGLRHLLLFVVPLLIVLTASGCNSDNNNDLTESGSALNPTEQPPRKTFKILHIMSYHSPWEWTDTQLNGFKDALKDVDVEYKVFQMESKNYSTPEYLESKGEEARQLIETWKPDLVFTSDDDAQTYVAKHYVNSPIPFVFSAVNEDPAKYGFYGSSNMSGVLETEHFVESAKLLKEIVPSVTKVAVVLDDSPLWEPVVERMKARLKDLPDLQFVAWDTILTYEEYKQKMLEYQNTVDAVALIGIFNFKDENNRNVPYTEVLEWTAANSNLPDFSFWKDRVTFGTLCTVSVSGYEQGLAAGKIAYGILVEGKKPSSFPITETAKGEPLINLARAKKLGIKLNSTTLLSAKVVNTFPWEK